MSDNSDTWVPPTPDEVAVIKAEMGAMERRRALVHGRFRWSFFLGAFLAVIGTVILSATDSLWSFAPAVASLAAATAFYAKERGRRPAWGVLSLPGLAILNVLPDLNAEQLDELERRMTGKSTILASKEQLSQAFWLPVITAVALAFAEEHSRKPGPNGLLIAGVLFAPLGLFHAIRLLLDAHRHRKAIVLPITATVWAGFWTFVAANIVFAIVARQVPWHF